jgi:Polyketide cyclase / dehydrase and lipid transport
VIIVTRTVHTAAPADRVAAYLSDFTTSATWDPHTAACRRVDDGPLTQSAVFDNVQRIGPIRSRFRYQVQHYAPGHKIVLISDSRTLTATDTMVFRDNSEDRRLPGYPEPPAVDGPQPAGATVVCTAQFDLKGAARPAEPLLRRVMSKVADDGADGMRRTLDNCPSRSPHPDTSPNPPRSRSHEFVAFLLVWEYRFRLGERVARSSRDASSSTLNRCSSRGWSPHHASGRTDR